ncbi:hypothetical protein SAMN04487998_3190 [Hymenobacter actinosclerus]|uniref:Uncharacterized protein n=2 Tax=Hymenobacter actinosclerus TaxID=82805 RepID=A0A1I0I9V7_9BACT|nr:hypothetical protein SAMN04487998_3190 [Hymenobacter actinosclerus]
MAEDFPAKMSRKTVAELREYVEQRYQYREEAVLAALTELERRGLPEPNAEALMAELRLGQEQTERREAVVRAEVAEQVQARRVARGEASPDAAEVGPRLFSLGAITIFSVLFSMIAGGVMLVLNLRTLQRGRAALLVVAFVLAYVFGGGYLVLWLKSVYGEQVNWLGSFFNLPAILVYNLFFWPRYIGRQPYRSRSWVGPLLICGLLMLGLYYLLVQLHGIMPAGMPGTV